MQKYLPRIWIQEVPAAGQYSVEHPFSSSTTTSDRRPSICANAINEDYHSSKNTQGLKNLTKNSAKDSLGQCVTELAMLADRGKASVITFQETEFITVTAYQNQQVRNNPLYWRYAREIDGTKNYLSSS